MTPRPERNLLVIRDKHGFLVEAFDLGNNILDHIEFEKLSSLIVPNGWTMQHQTIHQSNPAEFETDILWFADDIKRLHLSALECFLLFILIYLVEFDFTAWSLCVLQKVQVQALDTFVWLEILGRPYWDLAQHYLPKGAGL